MKYCQVCREVAVFKVTVHVESLDGTTLQEEIIFLCIDCVQESVGVGHQVRQKRGKPPLRVVKEKKS